MQYLSKRALPIIAAATVLSVSPVHAEWTGQGEAGYIKASGNTDSENINIGFSFLNEAGVWSHEFGVNALRAASNGVDTSESASLDYIAKRDLTDRSYLFAGLGYLDDDFDGFTEQASASVGYGYRVIDTDSHGLEVGVGVGYRDTHQVAFFNNRVVDGEDVSGATGVLFMNYRNMLTSNTEFLNDFGAEIGSDNTFVENEAALVVSMNDELALKAGVLIRHNSDPAVGFDDTDTITSLSLVYNIR